MALFASIRQLLPNLDWLFNAPQPTGPFTPTYNDVCHARQLLHARKLPMELVLIILDHAQYWPSHHFKTRLTPGRPFVAAARSGRPSAATHCLDAAIFNNPIVHDIRTGGEQPKVKSLQFNIVSHDQGWTTVNTHGTYSTSSWLEVSIIRAAPNINSRLPSPRLINMWISSPLDYHTNMTGRGWSLVKRPESAQQGPQGGEGDFAWYLQGNCVAAERQEYCVVWSECDYDGNGGAGTGEGFLQNLQGGDKVLVWARAKWSGWQCIVHSIEIKVQVRDPSIWRLGPTHHIH